MKTITLRNGLIKSSVGNSIMLYDIEGEMFYSFNETASMIIDLMGFNLPVLQIKQTISLYFEPTSSIDMNLSIDAFIKKLELLKFIEFTSIINKDYTQCSKNNKIKFLEPSFKKYSKEWLLKNHPGVFYNLTFSDRWSPSGGETPGTGDGFN